MLQESGKVAGAGSETQCSRWDNKHGVAFTSRDHVGPGAAGMELGHLVVGQEAITRCERALLSNICATYRGGCCAP